MLELSLFPFGLLFLAIARALCDRYRARLAQLEREWLADVRYGLSEQFFFVEPKRLRKVLRAVGVAGAALAAVSFSPFPLVAGLAVAWVLPHLFLRLLRRRRRRLFERQFGVALPQLSSILHAGHTFERALESLARTQPAPLGQELQLLLKELKLGTSLDEALENLCRRFPARDVELVARAVSISRRVGSSLSEAFDRVAEMIRARAALADRLSSLTAQGRLQGWIAIAMPIGVTAVLRLIAPDYLDPLFHTAAGRLILAAAALGMALGGIWIHRIGKAELVR